MDKKPDNGMSNKDLKKILTNRKPYEIPPNLIQILNEHSCGFILATLDHNGNFNFAAKHDNEIIGEAMEKRLLDYLTIRQEAMDEIKRYQMMSQMGLIQDGGEEED